MVSPLYSIVSEFLTGRLTRAVGLVVVLQQPSWRSFRSCPHVRGYFATLCVLAFVPLQTGFLVTRTDLYKCPLSVQNYRFLKNYNFWAYVWTKQTIPETMASSPICSHPRSSNTDSALSHSSVSHTDSPGI